MKKDKADEVCFPDRSSWRSWLKKNHDKSNGIWLIYYKKHTGKNFLSYNDAVEEALCFGWIDSTVNKVDEERYKQIYTPRNKKSIWSETNIIRVKKLIKEGKMTPAGLAKIDGKLLSAKPTKKDIEKRQDEPVPSYIPDAIKANEKAWEYFRKLANSYKKIYIYWINSAKKAETRLRRLKEAMGYLEENKKLPMK